MEWICAEAQGGFTGWPTAVDSDGLADRTIEQPMSQIIHLVRTSVEIDGPMIASRVSARIDDRSRPPRASW
jgi:hypothetical protein